jgi:ABC-type multidrug transport system fused ATPase/permease subunit
MSSQAVSMKAAVGHAGNLYDLVRDGSGWASETTTPIDAGRIDERILEPRIEVADVDFRYPNAATRALCGINLTIAAGSFVALVGSTGAGKSTLADVILGLVPVESGTVRIGGYTPETVIADWPGAMAYVPQTVTMVTGTVRDNVALALPPDEIDDDLIWSTLNRVRLAHYFSSQRDGLDTAIGERGIGLSGGQRQRLGIARALYSQPKILVLDEATSALDAETEAAIAETIIGLQGQVTRIVIAHRLATVRAADLVVLLSEGRTEASGSFDQVRAASAEFDFAAALMGLDK